MMAFFKEAKSGHRVSDDLTNLVSILRRDSNVDLARQKPQTRKEFAAIDIAPMQMSKASGWIKRVAAMQNTPVVEDDHLARFQLQGQAVF